MPNHVINEIVFSGVDSNVAEQIIELVRSHKREIDFEILLPVPLNSWMGSVGSEHERKFPLNALDWCTANWSTKWNAYGEQFIDYRDDKLVLRFRTAWRAPYGWMCALFNKSQRSFDYQYFSEGESRAHGGRFEFVQSPWTDCEWKECESTDEENDRMGVLLWGADAWEEINSVQHEATDTGKPLEK